MTRKNKISEKDRVADEFFFQEENEWFYDESEQIWKRMPGGDTLKRLLCLAVPGQGQYISLRSSRLS